MTSIDQQAAAALDRLKSAPPAVFAASGERQARWSAAVAHLAQAIAIFAEVAVSGDADALEADGRLGDANLVTCAQEAVSDMRADFAILAGAGSERRLSWVDVWQEMVDGLHDGAAGQQRLVTIAEAVERRFPRRFPKVVPS